MRRLTLAFLLALTACRSPTAPEVVPECTISTPASGLLVHLCYRPCPPGAEAFARGAELLYTTEYLCQ